MSHGLKPTTANNFKAIARYMEFCVECNVFDSGFGVQHIISINKITLKLVETFIASTLLHGARSKIFLRCSQDGMARGKILV